MIPGATLALAGIYQELNKPYTYSGHAESCTICYIKAQTLFREWLEQQRAIRNGRGSWPSYTCLVQGCPGLHTSKHNVCPYPSKRYVDFATFGAI